MKQPLRITRQAFWCIATIALIAFGARFSTGADFGPRILGTWIGHKDGGKITLVFRPDDTVRWTEEDPKTTRSFSAKYRIDYSTKPLHLDIFDFNPATPDQKGQTWRFILEFDEIRPRFRTDIKPSGERPEEFGENAIFFMREDVVAATHQPSVIGTWIGHDEEGGKRTFAFKADNTFLFTDPKGDSLSAKYQIDYFSRPIHLDIFDFKPVPPDAEKGRGASDHTWRGILEFDGDSRFRFDANVTDLMSGENPKEFSKGATVFTKEEVSAAAEHPSVIGTWLGQAEHGTKVTLAFKADNTVLYTRNEPNNLQEPPREDVPSSLSAKYKIDYSTKPIQLEIFDFNPPPTNGFTERATLEFEGESRFRLATTPGGTHPEIFGENAIVFTKEEVRAAAEHPSIIGTWTAQDPAAKDGPVKVTFVFKADKSVLWITEEPKHLFSLSAKYRIDYSTKPIHLDIFDVNDPRAPRDYAHRCILEFDGESRFRFEATPSGERPEEFGKNAAVFTKVEFSVPAGHPSILGTWIAQEPSTKMTLEFKADNTVLWITESPKTNLSSSGKYRIDYSTKPIQLDIFDFDLPPRPGKSLTFFGIVEFEGESRFRFDAQICTGEQSDGRPKVFTNASVFTKVQ